MKHSLYFAAAAPFEAARKVNILPSGHRSATLHGHSFSARVRAELPQGWGSCGGGECDVLQRQLEHCVSRIDYTYLNDLLEIPTDENLARWFYQNLAVPGIQMIGIQSTAHEGADLDDQGNAHIWRRYRFESAHKLPNVHVGHKCGTYAWAWI